MTKELFNKEPVRILRAEIYVGMGLITYLLTDFTTKTMSSTQADKMGWWEHGKHAVPGAAPPAAPAPGDMVMVPRDILVRLVEEARVFEPSVLDPDALAHARRILAAAPAPAVPLTDEQFNAMFEQAVIECQGGMGSVLERFGLLVLSAAPVVPAKRPPYESTGDYPSNDSYQEGYTEGWNDCIDAVGGIGTTGATHV